MMDNLSTLKVADINGPNGIRFAEAENTGVGSPLFFYQVAGNGDLNSDGLDDVAIIAPYGVRGESLDGVVHVVYGQPGGLPDPVFDLNTLDGTNGFGLYGGFYGNQLVHSVAFIGDVNDDGIDDLLMGAETANASQVGDRPGGAYVLFGSTSGFPAVMTTLELDGTNGFVMSGLSAGDRLGYAVSGGGDFNGDGISDFVVGTRGGDTGLGTVFAGYAYVVYGTDAGFPAELDLTTLDGTNGFRMNGLQDRAILGAAVSLVGDLNGDGFDDAVIGESSWDNATDTSVGSVHVIFGTDAAMPATLTRNDLDGSNGFRLIGTIPNNLVGYKVPVGGDFNGDGLADLFITSSNNDIAYVVFGSSTGFDTEVILEDLDGTDGFRLTGRGGTFMGRSADFAGDVNGDGFDDLLIGAYSADSSRNYTSTGEAYVVLGTDAGLPATFDLQTLDGTNGFVIDADVEGGQLGITAAAAGDTNQDGYDDILVGSVEWGQGIAANLPRTYLIYGGPDGFQYDRVNGTDNGEVIIGTTAQELIKAMGGNDWIVSGGSSDGIDGGAGVDMVSFAGSARIIQAIQTDAGFTVGNGLGSRVSLENVEGITGTSSTDVFHAHEGRFRGLGGQDTFHASGLGVGRYEGGGSRDLIDYSRSDAGITASLFRERGWTGDAVGDRYDSIEDLIATNFDDMIWGDNANNRLEGLHGDDTITGAGGDDYILAGLGTDVIVFSGNQADYRIAQDGIRTEVEHLGGGYDGTDVIGHAEILRFADGDFVL